MEMIQSDKQNGFTLVEILVVITLIALLASLVAPKLFSKLGSSKVKAAKAQIQMIDTAIDAFRLDLGRYPTKSESLVVLWKKPESLALWDGPYLPKAVPADPWGRPYSYKVPGSDGHEYDLLSLGSDGAPGGEGEAADLSVWD